MATVSSKKIPASVTVWRVSGFVWEVVWRERTIGCGVLCPIIIDGDISFYIRNWACTV